MPVFKLPWIVNDLVLKSVKGFDQY